MIAPLLLLAACGAAVVARDLGSSAQASLRGARVSRSSELANAREGSGKGDDPPTTKEMLVNATEGKPVKFAEEVLNKAGMMPAEANCNGFFMKWEVEGHDGGKEQGFCEINDLLMPFVATLLFAAHFATWFALCRKRKRTVKGPYGKADTNYIQALDKFKPIGSNSVLIFETLWWWFACLDDWAGPMATVRAIGNVIEANCCFCWMHADTLTRSGLATNLSAYGNGCLMCLGPGPMFPCFWVSSFQAMKTRKLILEKVDSKYTPEQGGAQDFLLHCCCPSCTHRQEAELVECCKAFENGQGPPTQQSMKGKGFAPGAASGVAAVHEGKHHTKDGKGGGGKLAKGKGKG